MMSGRRTLGVAVGILALAAAMVTGAPPSPATGNPVCTTVDQVTVTSGGQSVNASYSGNGGHIAFVSNRDFIGTNSDGNNEIFVYDVGTATYTQVTATTGSGGVNVPSISSAGSRVAFQSSKNLSGGNADGNNEIFVWDAAGPTLTQVTTSSSTRTNASPKLSADGTHVTFSSDADLTGGNADLNQEIFLWEAAGATTTQVTATTGGFNGSPSINADGTKVAFRSNRDIGGANSEGNNEIFLYDAAGPTTTAVTSAASGASDGPSISGNGSRIAFRSTANLGGGNADANQEIFLWSSTGPTTTQVTVTTGGSSDGPSLSSDGTRLALRSNRDLVPGGNTDLTNEIYAYDGSGLTQITATPVGGSGNRAPTIAGDGSSIAFESDRDVTGSNSDHTFEIFRTACGLEVTKTADQASVAIGEPIDYHVTVHNGGSLALTGLYVDDPHAPDCSAGLADLASGQSVTVDCTYTPTLGDLGTYTNVATVDADQAPATTSNQVDVDVTYPSGAGAIDGTITETGTGLPLPGAWAAILRTSDFSIAAGAVADGDGRYAALVPAGSYFIYLIDPTGTHTAAFHGAPTLVTVADGGAVTADPVMAPNRGQITGTVTEQGSGDPLAGRVVVSIGGPSTSPELGTVTDGSGAFTLPDLPAGNHWVGYLDPAGTHATEFYPHSPNVPDATAVVVTGGGSTPAPGSLPTQVATPGGAALTGTVVESGFGDPLGDVLVVALRAADYQPVRTTMTDGFGEYALDVAAGDYRLAFVDTTGRHRMEWYDDLPNTGLESAVAVTAPGSANAALDLTTGRLAGTVTDDPGGTPLAGAWAIAIGPAGIVGGAVAAPDGTYTIPELPVGTYHATFVDPVGGRPQEYWPNSATYAGSTPFAVTGGATTTADIALG